MSVTLLEVMAAAQARRAPLVAELAGYLVLGAADQSAGAPRRMRAGDVVLAEDGAVRIVGAGEACAPTTAEDSLRALLRSLMGVASSATPALLRSTQRPAGAGVDALIRELETALIPVNRAAARRSLSRLHRETTRALSSGRVDAAAFAAVEPEASTALPAAVPPVVPPVKEPVAAPVAPEPEPDAEPEEWSVPLGLLETSPPSPEARESADSDQDDPDEETAPEPVVARARASSPPEPELVELSPSVLEVEPASAEPPVALEPSPPELPDLSPPRPRAAPARPPSPHTPVIELLYDEPAVGYADADVTDRVPQVFEVDQTQPLEQRAESTQPLEQRAESTRPPEVSEPLPLVQRARRAQPELARIAAGEESVETPAVPSGEPFRIAPSADPPDSLPRSRTSVVVVGGAAVAAAPPGPASEAGQGREAEPPVQDIEEALRELDDWSVEPGMTVEASAPTPPVEPDPTPPPRTPGTPKPDLRAPARFTPRQSDVSELLDSFEVAETRSDREVRGDLKRIAGLEPTPPPAAATEAEERSPAEADAPACEAR